MRIKDLHILKFNVVLFLLLGSLHQVNAQLLPGTFSSSWIGNTFGGKNSSSGFPDKDDVTDDWVQNYFDCMTVTPDGTCYTSSEWDEAGRTHGIYKDGDVLGNGPGVGNCGSAGGFTISGTTISGNGKTISDVEKPTAIAMGDGALAGKLLVADDGAKKQILIYDVSGTPTVVEAIGAEGGIASSFTIGYDLPASINAPAYPAGTYGPGVYHPLKLWGITGVGCDNQGRVFVSHDQMGSGIRCFKKVSNNWQLDWRVESYFFVDNVYYDEKTDGVDIYGVQEHFKMNFNTNAAGQEWSIYGYSLDSYTYPQDPRGIEDVKAGHEHGLTGTVMREINGSRYLWVSGMTCQSPKIFKYKPGTEVAVSCGMFFGRSQRLYDLPLTYPWPPERPSTNSDKTMYWEDFNDNGKYEANEYTDQTHDFDGGDFFVDKSGNIWQGQNPITVWNASFLSNGNIHYSSNNLTTYNITGISDIGKIVYQEDKDRLVLLTEPCRNITDGKVYIVDNWSTGNRAARYVSTLFGPNQSSWSAAGDYSFEVGWETRAKVWVTDLNTGELIGTMIPSAACGGIDRTGWVDIAAGLQAYKRSNGEYLVFVEDDFLSRVILYRWCPSGTCDTGGGPVQGILISPETSTIKEGVAFQITPTITPFNADNRSLTWSSDNTSVATVSSSGLVRGVGVGSATITVTTVDGNKTATMVVTVTGAFKVEHADVGLYIDGKLEESSWQADNVMSKPLFGVQNNESKFDLLWDANYLYVGIQVMDEALKSLPENNPWNNDAIEIFIDGNQDKSGEYDEYDIQIIKVIDSTAVWTSRSATGIVDAVALIAGGYSMEVAIPWSVVNKFANAGSGLGFDISIDDNDMGTTSRDGGTIWFGDGNNFMSTTNFDDILLMAGSTSSIPATGISIDSASISVLVGATKQLTAEVLPLNATNKNVVWSSSNPSMASVSQSGLVSGLSAGELSVKAKTVDGNFQATCLVTSKSIITSNDEDAGGNINVYPNPVAEGKIYLSGVSGSTSIKITDALGKIMFLKTTIVNGVLEIDDLKLRPGVYFLSVQNDTRVFKLIVK